MKRLFALLVSVVGLSLALPVMAGDCFVDPTSVRTGTATVTTGARMRSTACMEGSEVYSVAPQGATVTVVGETDGWYKIEWNGHRGWVGMQLIRVNGELDHGESYDYDTFETKYPSRKASASVSATPILYVTTEVTTDAALTSRLKGYILLQTQSHGEAWYVDPKTARRFYMKDGPTAYEMMRKFGLGITDADLARLKSGNASLLARLRGRIVLQVQAHGEAYYIHPKTGAVTYLKDGEAAYSVLRTQSLGIVNADLEKIPSGAF